MNHDASNATAASGDTAAMFEARLQEELHALEKEHDTKSVFRKHLPRREPLLGRRWVPYVCVAGLIAIWTPVNFKVAALQWVDAQHDAIKLTVHKVYWRWTMPPEQFAVLMRQLEANVPKSERVKSTDCPL